MRGQPGHGTLEGNRVLEEVRTAARYRLWKVDGRWPALIPDPVGIEIAAELYDLEPQLLARLAEVEPSGWTRGAVELADGRSVDAFLGDPGLRRRGEDVSAHGGWAAYVSRGRDS